MGTYFSEHLCFVLNLQRKRKHIIGKVNNSEKGPAIILKTTLPFDMG